jgi:hypothetical protein
MLEATQEVFELVLARPVVLEGKEHPALVHLWWRAPNQGNRVVQVYMDGRLVEVSQHVEQRELWLMCDRSRSHRFELLAVPIDDPDQIWGSRLDLLKSWDPPVKGELALQIIRDERLPVDTLLSVQSNGQVIDTGALWPSTENRGGFGAILGVGEFGYDAATGPGLGLGELGMGRLGADGRAWQWHRENISAGHYELSVLAKDQSGRLVAQEAELSDVEIEALPSCASEFSIDADFTLRWIT